jgi:hypothetical protein
MNNATLLALIRGKGILKVGRSLGPIISPLTSFLTLALIVGSLVGCGSGSGGSSVTLPTPGSAPSFSLQPLDQTVALGNSVTFMAGVSGIPAPVFQWKRDSVDIAGATSATYTIPVTTISDNGARFSVTAVNSAGSAISNTVLLTITMPQVPSAYVDLYSSLQGPLAGFDRGVTNTWNGQKSDVNFGGELLSANANRGQQLLRPNVLAGVRRELDSLKALGLRSVTVCIGFPVLYTPFFQFNGNAQDAAAYLAFYQTVASEIHQRNMKMVVESSLLFPGVYSAGSGFNLSGYYATLSVSELITAHGEMLALLAQQVRPDWINLGSEPDTMAANFGNQSLSTPAVFSALIAQEVARIRATGSTISLGAGVGTWKSNGAEFIQALAATGIDFIDLHIYPINMGFLDRLTQFTDYAQSFGKPVAISEAWLSKERDSEFSQYNAATDQTIFSRDAFSFWAPLDQTFLGSLVKFAHWKRLIYFSPFWTKYFHAYLDYPAVQGMTPGQITALSEQAASAALQAGTESTTGVFYGNAIR